MTGPSDAAQRVCSVADTIDRPILPVQAGDQQLLIIRDGNRLVACERACPHEQADLALGRCADGKLFCPRHFAWFDLADGAISPGWPAPALKLFPVIVRDGEVAVLLTTLTGGPISSRGLASD